MHKKYTLVSLLATGTDFVIFSMLIWVTNLYSAFSTFFGMMAGAVISWALHNNWVFVGSQQGAMRKNSLYATGIVLSIVLNVGLMGLCADWFALPKMESRIATATAVWAILYWFNKRVVFNM